MGRHNATGAPELAARDEEAARPELAPLLDLDDAAFRTRFEGRPIMRAKRDGFLRNVCVALGNVGTSDDLPALQRALFDQSALVRGHAAWAIAHLRLRHGLGKAPGLEAALAIEQDPFVREELQLALLELQFAT